MDAEQFHRITKALADPHRFEVFERIARETDEAACAALTDECQISQATVSHHIKELKNAGLIQVRRQAKFRFYRLERKTWSDYLAELRRRVPFAKPKPVAKRTS
jgi:ArsR family transcriptional regulator